MEQRNQSIQEIASRQYSIYDYLSSWCEYVWVYTYEKYYDTEKYKQWKFAAELLASMRQSRRLAEYLSPRNSE